MDHQELNKVLTSIFFYILYKIRYTNKRSLCDRVSDRV